MSDETQLKQEDDSLDLLISAPSEPPAPVKKVELDLDDAPFLKADDQAPDMPAPVDAVPENADDGSAKKRKKKIILIAAIALGALAVGAAAAWWFFMRTPPPPPPPGLEPEVIVVPKAAAPVAKSETITEFAPFIIPIKNTDGKTSFLVCKFSAIATDATVARELDQQRIALRDAIYYYLRGKDNAFLLDAHNGEQIKKELMSVFNDYLTQGKLDDILFESYLNR